MTKEYKKINQELQELKQQVQNFENKYLWSREMALINTVLNVLKVDQLTVTKNDIEKYSNKPYIAEYDYESGILTIKKFIKF